MRKLLKLFGVGLLTGAGTRAGCWLMDAFLQGGFGNLWGNFKDKMRSTREIVCIGKNGKG